MKNRKMCRYLIALLAVAVIVIPVLFSAPSTAKADDVKYAKIVSESGGGVWFRETPGGNQLSLLSNGWVMQVLGEAKASNGGVWIHLRGTVSSGSSTVREGYVYTDYVVNLTPEETEVYVATHKLPDPKPVDPASSWGITTANVNLRASASTSSAKVDGLKSGTVVEIITAPKGTSSSYWYYVRVNSKVGYVNAPYIRVLTQSEAEKRGLITPKPEDITPKPDETTPKPDETTPKPDETTPAPINPDDYDTYVVVKIGSLNFRVGPSTSNSSLGFLNKGDVLPFYGYDSTKKWCHVYSSTYGCFGYVSNNSNYITVKTNDKPTTPVPDPVTPEPTDPDAVIGYVAVKNAAINVRKSNSISSAIVTTAKANTVLEMLGSAKDANYNYTWFKVRTPDGKTGYVRNDVAYQMNDWQVEVWKTTGKLATPTPASKETTPKTSEPSGYSDYIQITASSATLRASASTTSAKVDSASRGKVFKKLGTTKVGGYTWYKIQASSSKVAYVRGDLIKVMTVAEYQAYAEANKTPTPRPTATPFIPGTADLSDMGIVTLDNSNLRQSSTTSSTSLGKFDRGTTVKYLGNYTTEGKLYWYNVQVGDVTGWMRSDVVRIFTPREKAAYQQSGNPDNWPEASYTTLSVGSEGEAVKTLQKELISQGFLDPVDSYGTYGSKTEAAVKKFQAAKGLTVDGIAGADTQHALFRTVPEGTYSQGTDDPDLQPVEMADWFKDVNDFWERGIVATVTDVKTGLSFRAKRWAGGNHADVEPLTAEDTKVMCRIYGVSCSQDIEDLDLYERRPLWVTVTNKGVTRTFAASMYGEPHNYPDGDSIPDNDFRGQFCIHFLNSKTSGTKVVDAAHQKAIKYAYDKAKVKK